MIVTLTPNPSIDATLALDVFTPGQVNRTVSAFREPGGKGINVSHACANAGHPTLAIAPTADDDPFVALCATSSIPLTTVPISGRIRTNTTLTERDGRTTKINETGPTLSTSDLEHLTDALVSTVRATNAQAVVLAGSLPPDVPDQWYATLVHTLKAASPHTLIAVDTSDNPLRELGRNLQTSAPNIIKPNAFELAQLTGSVGGANLEQRAAAGDYDDILASARLLVSAGIDEVLVTLGAAGASLITAAGAWAATPPPVTTRSTVGAGDCALAGYIMARAEGISLPECLRRSVAYGSAATSLPGTAIPHPADVNLAATSVFDLPNN